MSWRHIIVDENSYQVLSVMKGPKTSYQKAGARPRDSSYGPLCRFHDNVNAHEQTHRGSEETV